MHALTVALCVALALALLALCLLVCAAVLVACELRRMTETLQAYRPGANGRLTVSFHWKPLVGLARSMNAVLDAERDERGEEFRARKAFQGELAALSHDIRTPLAGAQGYLELHGLASGADERRRYLEAAQERLSAVRVLVEDLFDYTKAASAEDGLRPEPVSVCTLVTEALVAQYPAFAEKGWEPEVDFADEGMTVEADREALLRVVGNLVSNALRHGSAAPRICQRGRTVMFANAVDDPAAIDASRLFERFYRADEARGGGGSGLGLAIVARLCAAMGIEVGATVRGDTLRVTLTFPEAT